MLAFALTVAIVTHDQTPLAASTDEKAARQAMLFRGDWLEVRGELRGRLKVYDHRHERPGYVAPWQVRRFAMDESSAPALRAIVDFVRDEPGAESLGIGVTALYLKVAPAAAIGADVFDALGGMAERLARRASRGGAAGEVDVAESYGVKLLSIETEAGVRLCYDGEAFRRVLADNAATPEARARAALGLTDPVCAAPPTQSPVVEEQLAVLERAAGAPPVLGNRVRLRRAGLLATLAWLRARRGDDAGATQASAAALDAYAGVERTDLTAEDGPLNEEIAVRVAAARWLREPSAAPATTGVHVELAAGQPGETCVRLVEGKVTRVERCSYGLPFPQSVRVGPHGTSLALAVQLLPGWVELWLFHRAGDGWIVDTVAPGTSDPDLGYVEVAGFSPDGKRLLTVREARGDGSSLRRAFEVRLIDTLAVEHSARSPELLSAFGRWSAPEWRRSTVALR
jgi:hypothetical protein